MQPDPLAVDFSPHTMLAVDGSSVVVIVFIVVTLLLLLFIAGHTLPAAVALAAAVGIVDKVGTIIIIISWSVICLRFIRRWNCIGIRTFEASNELGIVH